MLDHLAFASPWLLGFLAVLPALWWLLRLMPPAPRKIPFPPLALLKGLVTRQEIPSRTPWWLLLLRVVIAALLIVALAKPLLDPPSVSANAGALLLVIDNNWAAARDWPERQNIFVDLVEKAGHDGRKIALLKTTTDSSNNPLQIMGPMAAESAMTEIHRLKPEAWNADWQQATTLLEKLDRATIGQTVWVASGLGDHDAEDFYRALRPIAPINVFGTSTPVYTVTPPTTDAETPAITVMRMDTDAAEHIMLRALGEDGHIVSEWPVDFAAGSPRTDVPLNRPPELRNQIIRFEVDRYRTAASTALLDATWQHRSIGITGDVAELDRHSLLSEIYYIDRALKPTADIHIDTLEGLLKANLPVIFMTDATEIASETLPTLTGWIQHGGILVRFTGERFAGADNHDKEKNLLPVSLRNGNRSFGGALSWGAPQKLKAFPATSPFHNLAVPADVTINRQILAEPAPDLAQKSWAEVEDGTPLVTATSIGQGISVLFHVPAQSNWSNLPLSGLFVDMLQKIVLLSHSHNPAHATSSTALRPISLLDAGGDAHPPTATALLIQSDAMATTPVTPQHPPGLYGGDSDSLALNLGPAIGQPEALQGINIKTYTPQHHGVDIQPWLLLAAFLLLGLDFLVSLRLRGLLRLAVLLLGLIALSHPAEAGNDEKLAIELTSKPYLAYVQTGDSAIDHVSELGLRGLALLLQRRTSLDDVGVARVNPDTDDLTYYPLLYWPVTATQNPLSEEGAKRVTHYLHHGGMILFDAAHDDAPSALFLHHVLNGVDLPPLVRLPEKHVLKRSFYLLDSVPGRFADRDFWLEPENASTYDDVASVLYGSNDWAAAWAVDNAGQPLYPCTPGGEAQREYAYRFGINLVIYSLTGIYKNHQLGITKMLEQMGP